MLTAEVARVGSSCCSSRFGEFVSGRGNNGQCQDVVVPRRKATKGLLIAVAKVAVGDSGRQTGVLQTTTEGSGETTTSKSQAHKRFEFHTGRLDNVDRSTTKVTGKGMQKGRVVVISGPTAVGKSRIAIALAKQLGGEIISADSIQVFEGMDVGSAKTPENEREGVPHHLLDMVSPGMGAEYSASQFFKDARAATELVLARNRVPIVVGGTCTYLRWYMNGKAGAPPAPPEVSAFVDGKIRRLVSQGDVGWKEDVDWLAKSGDPATAFSLRKNDWYHLQRALEVIKTCGQPRGVFPKPFNYTQDHMDGSEWDYDYDFQCYFLYQHRAELYHWIDYRCEQMLADLRHGLLEEASWLLDLGLTPASSSASRGIGYQEAMEFLVECRKAGGTASEKEFLAFLSEFQHVSRSLVKKQLTWFRSEQHSDVKQFHWIDASQPTDKILEALRKEYWRRPGYPSELRGSDARKYASYKEGKILKYYEVKNRIFTSSAAIAPVLKWVKQTQGDRRFQQRSLIRY